MSAFRLSAEDIPALPEENEAGETFIRWQTAEGHTDRIQRSPDGANWITVSPPVAGDNGEHTFKLLNPGVLHTPPPAPPALPVREYRIAGFVDGAGKSDGRALIRLTTPIIIAGRPALLTNPWVYVDGFLLGADGRSATPPVTQAARVEKVSYRIPVASPTHEPHVFTVSGAEPSHLQSLWLTNAITPDKRCVPAELTGATNAAALADLNHVLAQREAIIDACLRPTPQRHPVKHYTVWAFADDSALVQFNGRDGSPLRAYLPSLPVRALDANGLPTGPQLTGAVDLLSFGPAAADSRYRLHVMVLRALPKRPAHEQSPRQPPPPGTPWSQGPWLSEEQAEDLQPLLDFHPAVLRKLTRPVVAYPEAPSQLDDRAAFARQFFRIRRTPAYDRDANGDGILDIWANCATPVITEVCALNNGNLEDEQGDKTDWIEIYNPTTASFDLTGWFLTDNIAQLQKWVFPSGATIAAGNYMVVFADAENLSTFPFHTNFGLSQNSETVALTNPQGVVCSQVTPLPGFGFGSSETNQTWGWQADAAGNAQLAFFLEGTPVAHNTTAGYLGLSPVPKLALSHGGAFEDEAMGRLVLEDVPLPFSVTFAAAAPVPPLIFYCANGAPASVWSELADDPLTVDRTTTLRFFSHLEGFLPSPVVTRSFLFRRTLLGDPAPPHAGSQSQPALYPAVPEVFGYRRADYDIRPDVIASQRQSAPITGGGNDAGLFDGPQPVPMVLLTVSADLFFGSSQGIYRFPYNGVSEPREIPASFEWIAPGSTLVSHAQDCRLNMDSHRLELHFGRAPDGQGLLDLAVFPTAQGTGSVFETLMLRRPDDGASLDFPGSAGFPSFPNLGGTFCRDAFMVDAQRGMAAVPAAAPGGWPARGLRMAHVFINGLYWGLHHLTEGVDRDYLSRRHGTGIDYQSFEVFKGNEPALINQLLPYMQEIAPLGPGQETVPEWVTLNRWLDVDRFCDYVLLMTLATHDDWDGAVVMGRRIPQLENGQIKSDADYALRFYIWDSEPALRENDARDYFDPLSASLPEPILTWLPVLRQSALFRWHFAARSQAMMTGSGPLTVAALQSRWDAVSLQQFRPVLWPEAARWSALPLSPSTILSKWETSQAAVRQMLSNRHAAQVNNLSEASLWNND